MKRFYLFLFACLTLIACNKSNESADTNAAPPSVDADTLIAHVRDAVLDPDRSLMDVKDEIYMLIDTLQDYVANNPNERERFNAHLLALGFSNAMMEPDYCSPEDINFFIDSLVLPFADVIATWYCPTYNTEENEDPMNVPALSQQLLFYDQWYGDLHCIDMGLYRLMDGAETMEIILPLDAEYLALISFHDDDMEEFSDVSFTQDDAHYVIPAEDGYGVTLLFGRELIDEMLKHNGMYIGYIGEEQNEDHETLFYDCHLRLNKFQEQYRKLK